MAGRKSGPFEEDDNQFDSEGEEEQALHENLRQLLMNDASDPEIGDPNVAGRKFIVLLSRLHDGLNRAFEEKKKPSGVLLSTWIYNAVLAGEAYFLKKDLRSETLDEAVQGDIIRYGKDIKKIYKKLMDFHESMGSLPKLLDYIFRTNIQNSLKLAEALRAPEVIEREGIAPAAPALLAPSHLVEGSGSDRSSGYQGSPPLVVDPKKEVRKRKSENRKNIKDAYDFQERLLLNALKEPGDVREEAQKLYDRKMEKYQLAQAAGVPTKAPPSFQQCLNKAALKRRDSIQQELDELRAEFGYVQRVPKLPSGKPKPSGVNFSESKASRDRQAKSGGIAGDDGESLK